MQLYVCRTVSDPGAAEAIVPQNGAFVNTHRKIVFHKAFPQVVENFRKKSTGRNRSKPHDFTRKNPRITEVTKGFSTEFCQCRYAQSSTSVAAYVSVI